MRAYAVKMFCEPVEPIEQPDPQPKGTEVVIEVTRCGVCHSDLHIQDGYYDLGGGKRLSLGDRGVSSAGDAWGTRCSAGWSQRGPTRRSPTARSARPSWSIPGSAAANATSACAARRTIAPSPPRSASSAAGRLRREMHGAASEAISSMSTGIDPTLAATYACSGITAYSALTKIDIDKDNGARC